MNDALFDRWLYESESDSLDFKREQYRFIGATDNDKSELLKDILAMANSWRQIDGYIVIGIDDRPEKPNILHGVTEHIDDAQLQQFINSKLHEICTFEYRTFTKDEKTYGILRIPIQKRPKFLSKDYGKLKSNTVYVRRGSSTDEAKPDEIARMGADQLGINIKPKINIEFYDKSTEKTSGDIIVFQKKYYDIAGGIPDYSEEEFGIFAKLNVTNADNYRKLVNYINFKSAYSPLCFSITNNGTKEAVNIRIEFEILGKNMQILLDGDEISAPKKEYFSSIYLAKTKSLSNFLAIQQHNKWIVNYKLDRLHAKRTLNLDGIIYIQALDSNIVDIKTTIYFDGQEIPHEQNLKVTIEYERIKLLWNNFIEEFKQHIQ